MNNNNNNYNNNNLNNNYNNNNYNNYNNNNNFNNNYNNNNLNNNYINNNYYNNYNNNNDFNNNNNFNNNSINNSDDFWNNNSINTNESNNSNNEINIKPKENKNTEEQNTKTIQNIIKISENKFQASINQFKNYQIIESKKNLNYLITTLSSLEKTVQEKNQFALSLLPDITKLKNNISTKLNEYNYFTYILNQKSFQNIQYQRNITLDVLAEKYIMNRPFVSFDDIFDTTLDPNKPTKNILLDYFEKAQMTGYKSLFLYGPRGSGKTLYVHALASHLGAVLGQLDSLQTIKINYFVKEFARVITESTTTRPIIIYLKNVDLMAREALGEVLFLHDKFNTQERKCLFICSSPYPLRNLPYQLKFKYIQLINSANQSNKYKLFKFLFNQFGINFNMEDNDLSNLVYQNCKNYSNKDVFDVIKLMMDLRKQLGESINNMGRNELEKALNIKQGSLDPQSVQFYYL